MNAGPTFERVYDALKQLVMDRQVGPGGRLEPSALADALYTSVTPVRDALYRLTGERLVDALPSEGFRVPAISEPELQDLYHWSGELLSICLRARPSADEMKPVMLGELDGTASARAAIASALFLRIAHRTGNVEHAQAIRSTNDRLHAARLVEDSVLDGLDEELAQLIEAFLDGDRKQFGALLGAYHRRRHRAVSAIVRAHYRVVPAR